MQKPLIRIVDDDEDLRKTLEYLLKTEGWQTICYESAEDFLINDINSEPGCLILDVRMNGMSGLQLQQQLNQQGSLLPIIFFSAHGDIEMAVDSVKAGAEDFLPKTVDSEKLLRKVAHAVQMSLSHRSANRKPGEIINVLSSLTEQEFNIVRLLAKGLLNKEIAGRLGITAKTVYGHRVQIYRKLNVHSTAEISQLYEQWKEVKENKNV